MRGQQFRSLRLQLRGELVRALQGLNTHRVVLQRKLSI